MGRSSTVGAIVLDMGNPFYAQLVAGIEAAAESSSLAVISGSSGNREQRERLYLSLFEEQRARGILLASTGGDRKSTRLNSSHVAISYAVFCLKKKSHSITHIGGKEHRADTAGGV